MIPFKGSYGRTHKCFGSKPVRDANMKYWDISLLVSPYSQFGREIRQFYWNSSRRCPSGDRANSSKDILQECTRERTSMRRSTYFPGARPSMSCPSSPSSGRRRWWLRGPAAITREALERANLPASTERLLFKTRNSALQAKPGPHEFSRDFRRVDMRSSSMAGRSRLTLGGYGLCLSVQIFRDRDSLTHRLLLEAGVIVLKGVRLPDVPPGRFQLICLPIKLVGSDGAPARVILAEDGSP